MIIPDLLIKDILPSLFPWHWNQRIQGFLEWKLLELLVIRGHRQVEDVFFFLEDSFEGECISGIILLTEKGWHLSTPESRQANRGKTATLLTLSKVVRNLCVMSAKEQILIFQSVEMTAFRIMRWPCFCLGCVSYFIRGTLYHTVLILRRKKSEEKNIVLFCLPGANSIAVPYSRFVLWY